MTTNGKNVALLLAMTLGCANGTTDLDAATDTRRIEGGSDVGTEDAARDGGERDAGERTDAAPPDLGGCAIFPADSMWNTPIVDAPVHPSSDAYIATMGASTPLHPDFGAPYEGAPNGIPYVVVPEGQPFVPIEFTWADESEPGPYPIPPDAPIEGGPDGDGDRHILVVQTGACILYEVFNSMPSGGGWTGDSGAIWHLDRNERRPDGWTSADAAGLPIFPGLVRYDEAVETGAIEHALRVTVDGAQSAYIYPATHSDGVRGSDPDAPPMGLRLRLRADLDLTPFSPPVRAIVVAMQRYGLVVADTGSDWFVSGAPDDRWNDDMLRELGEIVGADFEAVYTGDAHPY